MTDPTVPPGAYHINLAGRLGEIGALIMANRLPMPAPNRPPSLNFDLGAEVAKVEQVAAALGVEVHQYGPRVQATWPPIHERGDGLPFATWVAHIPADRAGFEFSREMAPEDGELTQPGRIEPHTDETDGQAVRERYYEVLAAFVAAGGIAVGARELAAQGDYAGAIEWMRPIPPTDPGDLPMQGKPLISDETIAEAAAMEERDRVAGGPPWEVPDHPENSQPGGWHHGQIR